MLHLIFWVFILVLGLSYFGISVQAIVNSPVGQENVAYLSHLLTQAWTWLSPYIQPLLTYIQNIKP